MRKAFCKVDQAIESLRRQMDRAIKAEQAGQPAEFKKIVDQMYRFTGENLRQSIMTLTFEDPNGGGAVKK